MIKECMHVRDKYIFYYIDFLYTVTSYVLGNLSCKLSQTKKLTEIKTSFHYANRYRKLIQLP